MSNADIMVCWDAISDPQRSLLIEDREVPISGIAAQTLLNAAPFAYRAEGTLKDILSDLDALPDDLLNDISYLGTRFMALMQVRKLRVRVEGVTSNACKKLHADYTDLRLITTYAGQGTDYAPHGADHDGTTCCLEQLPAGAIGLFKGKLFGQGHAPCLHRSPAIEGTDQARLMLVIDTLEK